MFYIAVIITGFFAGLVASIAGFGIGSFLIPLISIRTEAKIAIVLSSLPHFLGTSSRFGLLKSKIDRKILIRFGLLSAVGGLSGALLHTFLVSNVLQIIFSVMLIIAGFLGVIRVAERIQFGKIGAGLLGFASGFFGGLVGEQGGIRSVSLLNFDISKEAFIATATATALIIDAVRMPVYFLAEFNQIQDFLIILILSSIAVVVGTFAGNLVLKRIPEKSFKKIASFLVFLLGIFMLTLTLFT